MRAVPVARRWTSTISKRTPHQLHGKKIGVFVAVRLYARTCHESCGAGFSGVADPRSARARLDRRVFWPEGVRGRTVVVRRRGAELSSLS